MSSSDERNPVLDGGIDYGRVFVTFTEHTAQKIAHGLIFEALLHALKEQGVVLKDGQRTTLVDLGCGEGRTACEMLDAINRVHPRGGGVDYYGVAGNRNDSRFVATLELLTFIAQRDLKGLAQEGKLESFIDDLKAQLDPTGTFEGVSDYQLMLSRNRSPEMQENVEAAVGKVVQALDRIGREAEEAFNQRELNPVKGI